MKPTKDLRRLFIILTPNARSVQSALAIYLKIGVTPSLGNSNSVPEFWGNAFHPTLTAVGVTWLNGFQFEIKVIPKLADSTTGQSR